MWFWQRKNVRRRYALWAKLLSVSAGAHAFFLLCMFFVYHGDTVDLFLEINTRNREGAPVVFKTFTSRSQRQAIKKAPVKKVVQLKKKAVQKKVVPPKPKPVPKTTVAQKEPVKKIQPKKEPKKIAPVLEKKIVQAVKKEEKKVLEPKEAVEQLEVWSTEQADVVGIPEYVFAFQKQIAQKFTPPIGIAPDAQCQIKMMIGWDGTMQEVGIERSSGILMYDVAARSAVHKLSLPRWTWGKSLTIVFKQ